MRITVQLIVESRNQAPTTTDIATIELDAASLGVHIAEARDLLERLQSWMVTAQVAEYIANVRHCPECGAKRRLKGHHNVVYRTVFGKLQLNSPRLYGCRRCCDGQQSFSPLATLLAERTGPELQYLQTKFAALMSYGLTVNVLGEILPLDSVLAVTSVRRSVARACQRIESQQETEGSNTSANACAATVRPNIPQPSPVAVIGVDGGYVRLAGNKSRRDGWFEVIVGKSRRTDRRPSGCFGYVQRLEADPAIRMARFLAHEGIGPDQPVTFLSDGGDTVRQAQFGPRISGEWVLDWFHIAMRFQNLIQIAKGLPRHQDPQTYHQIQRGLEGAKWHLWHGCWHRCLERLQWLTFDLAFDPCDAQTKLEAKLEENITYIGRNRDYIVNYGDRHRHGEPIASSFVESAVNQVVSKRFCKKQQMSWSPQNAHDLLQVRTAVLNGELRDRLVENRSNRATVNHEHLDMAA